MSLWNGHPPLTDPFLIRVARYATEHCGLVVTSTKDGTHAPASYHYSGRAVDLGLPDDLVGTAAGGRRLKRAQRRILKHFTTPEFTEYFGPVFDKCVRGGHRITISGPLAAQHSNHIHSAR